MKKIFSKEVIIGLCVAVAIAVLCFGIDYLKGINVFSPSNFYYASYDNVEGLTVSSPVTVNGFKVGTVRDISFDYEHPGKIKVMLALDKSLHLPEDSHAKIAQTLLSGGYIDLTLGASKNILPKGSELASGTVPDIMTTVTQDLMPSISSILPKVDSLLYNLNTLAADPALVQSIGRLNTITANIDGLVANLRGTMGKSVPQLVNKADRALVNVDSITSDLAVLSAQLKTLPLAETVDSVNVVTSRLAQFSKQLNDPNSSLGKLMNDPQIYNQVSRVAADVDSLIVDIKKNPKRYISIKLL